MLNSDRELYDHPTTRNTSDEYDPNERCFPGGPFHDIEAIELDLGEDECDSHTPTYHCRHCGHVWCEDPHKLRSAPANQPVKGQGRGFLKKSNK